MSVASKACSGVFQGKVVSIEDSLIQSPLPKQIVSFKLKNGMLRPLLIVKGGSAVFIIGKEYNVTTDHEYLCKYEEII